MNNHHATSTNKKLPEGYCIVCFGYECGCKFGKGNGNVTRRDDARTNDNEKGSQRTRKRYPFKRPNNWTRDTGSKVS